MRTTFVLFMRENWIVYTVQEDSGTKKMLDQLQRLHESGMYEDVKILSSLAISFLQKNPEQFGFPAKYQIFCFQGDAFFYTGEFHAASQAYKAALQIKTLIKGRGKKNSELPNETDIRFQSYECFMKLNMLEEALATLESIQPKQMTGKIYLAYATLLQKLGKENRAAISAYKEVLRENPTSLTAIQGLISLGVRADEVLQLVTSSLPIHASESFDWLTNWVKAQGLAQMRDFKAAAQTLESLEMSPNLDILAQTGELCFLSGDYSKALGIFKWVREINPLYYKKMDLYAYILYQEQGRSGLLEKLAAKAEYFPENVVVPWIVNGYYCISFNKAHKAVFFAQKALAMEPHNFEVLMMNGIALMTSSEPNEALAKFREAMSLCPYRYEPYYYVIEIYWKTGRRREALACAIEFQKNTPSSRSYALYAAVLMKEGTSNYDKARPILEKAISMDPDYLDAVLLLAKIHQNSQNCMAAVELLERHCPVQPSIRYHRMMASLLLKTKDKMKALDHSIIAKRLEPLIAKGSLGNLETPLRFFSEDDSNDGEVNAACSDNETL